MSTPKKRKPTPKEQKIIDQAFEAFTEAASQIARNQRVVELGAQLACKGPAVHLKAGAHGRVPVEDCLTWFKRGYAAAISHFVDGLSGDFSGLESALQESELDVSTSAGAFWDALCPDQTLRDADGGEC